MDELWKIWRQITPREGLLAVGAVMGVSFIMHMVIMLGTDRYIQALLG